MSGPIILAANTSWYLFNFRLSFARELRSRGNRVLLVAPRDKYTDALIREGFEFKEWNTPRAGWGILSALPALLSIFRIYHEFRPRAVHHFTLKCVFFGTLASVLVGNIRVVNSITGLGHVFIDQSIITKLFRAAIVQSLKILFRLSEPLIIFQNADDREYFSRLGLTVPGRTVEIATSGIDADYYSPLPTAQPPLQASPVVLFAGRLLKEKGVYEFLQAAEQINVKSFNVVFWLAGEIDEGNPSSLSPAELQFASKNKNIRFLGHVGDMRPVFNQASVFVLPSYREGGSRVILEAAAMGLPVVSTLVPGCQNLVSDNETGFLVPPKDANALAEAIERLLRDPGLAKQMGAASRKKVQTEFSVEQITRSTIECYLKAGIMA